MPHSGKDRDSCDDSKNYNSGGTSTKVVVMIKIYHQSCDVCNKQKMTTH